jgi:hypothetical protein
MSGGYACEAPGSPPVPPSGTRRDAAPSVIPAYRGDLSGVDSPLHPPPRHPASVFPPRREGISTRRPGNRGGGKCTRRWSSARSRRRSAARGSASGPAVIPSGTRLPPISWTEAMTSRGAGAARAIGREHDHDLHPCAQPWRQGGAEPGGSGPAPGPLRIDRQPCSLSGIGIPSGRNRFTS